MRISPLLILPLVLAPTLWAAYDPMTEASQGDARVIQTQAIEFLQHRFDSISPSKAIPQTLIPAVEIVKKAYRFQFKDANEGWVEPRLTEDRGWGDCQAKAFWTACKLIEAGYRDVGVVIGVPPKYIAGNPGHAWVVLHHDGRMYYADPSASDKVYQPDLSPVAKYNTVAMIIRSSWADRQAGKLSSP